MIVLIDDNAAHRHLIRRAVKKVYSVDDIKELASLAEGLRFVETAATVEIRFVIVDMNLGDGKGTEIIKEIRKRSSNAVLPVVVLSTSQLPEDQEEAKAAGATKYIVKSDDPELFAAAVTASIGELQRGM